MSEIKLRPYQRDAIDAVFAAWSEGMKRPALVLPTGAGKTVVFAHLIKEFRTWRDSLADGRARVMVLVHRDELADQAIAKIKAIAPELHVGKVKAESDETDADVMVCSVQTLAVERRMNRVAWHEVKHGDVGLIITDECHHGAAPTYQKIYAAFPDALNLGVTATLQRGDGVGLGSVWDDVVYSRSVLWMIKERHLADIRMKNVDIGGLDLSDVKRSRGDFQSGDLGKALGDSDMADKLPAAYTEHAGDRPGVVFTPTVETAQQVAGSFNRAGIRTAVIHGETPREDRLRIFEDYRTGRVQVLANCMVLTEGFDAPWASCAVIARPTQSAPLYTQMVGRVLRPYPGKKDALVLNVAGDGQRLCTLIDLAPGEVLTLDPDETLEEAAEREAKERGSISGDLKFTDVDAFAANKMVWLTTPAGVLFVPCGETTVFLWPDKEQPGLWDVCRTSKSDRKWRRTEHTGMDLGSAMAWGEATAEDYGTLNAGKKASWRRGPATEAQQSLAATLRIPGWEAMDKSQLSDAISLAFAAQTFDRFVGRV